MSLGKPGPLVTEHKATESYSNFGLRAPRSQAATWRPPSRAALPGRLAAGPPGLQVPRAGQPAQHVPVRGGLSHREAMTLLATIVTPPLRADGSEAAKHALSARDAVRSQLDRPRLRDICAKSVKNQRGEYPTNVGSTRPTWGVSDQRRRETIREMLALTSRMHWSRQQKSDVFPGRGEE